MDWGVDRASRHRKAVSDANGRIWRRARGEVCNRGVQENVKRGGRSRTRAIVLAEGEVRRGIAVGSQRYRIVAGRERGAKDILFRAKLSSSLAGKNCKLERSAFTGPLGHSDIGNPVSVEVGDRWQARSALGGR